MNWGVHVQQGKQHSWAGWCGSYFAMMAIVSTEAVIRNETLRNAALLTI